MIRFCFNQISRSMDPYFFSIHAYNNIVQQDCFKLRYGLFIYFLQPNSTSDPNQPVLTMQIISNIIEQSVVMLSSFSKHLSDNRHYTATLNRILNYISILVVDESNDVILACRLTDDVCPVTLLQMFNGKMDVLYAYLERDDTQIEIRQDMEEINIQYSLIVMKKTVHQKIRMPTKKYLLAKNSAFHPANSQSLQQIGSFDSFGYAENLKYAEKMWKDYLKTCNNQIILSKIHCQKSPDWLINSQPQLLLQLGAKIPKIQDQGISKYQVSIQLGQSSNEVQPRYDIILGIAHPARLEQIKQGYKGNCDDQISILVQGRLVVTRCFELMQNRTQEKVVYLSRLKIELIESRQHQNKRIESIIFKIDQKIINVISRQALQLFKINEYRPFVYFIRSFLHFSFDLKSYKK